MSPRITAADEPSLDLLCERLRRRDGSEQTGEASADQWPADSLRACGEFGIFEWFLPVEWGGQDWSDVDLLRGYCKLASACLTTTFVLTQRTGACQRIAASENQPLKESLLPGLRDGSHFTTLAISHLTTSRRHLGQPAMRAEPHGDGFVLDGYSAWVTGAAHAQTIVTGAELPNGEQILVALPTDLPGVTVPAPLPLVALSGSHTGPLECHQVQISGEHLLDGPVENVLTLRKGSATGGLQTSALALGLSLAAIDFLLEQSAQRPELREPAEHLAAERQKWLSAMEELAQGGEPCSAADLRAHANSLALRSTQAALAAAKGTGFVAGHPAGHWCREALFFLVWSCPQPVVAANLCEWAGLGE